MVENVNIAGIFQGEYSRRTFLLSRRRSISILSCSVW